MKHFSFFQSIRPKKNDEFHSTPGVAWSDRTGPVSYSYQLLYSCRVCARSIEVTAYLSLSVGWHTHEHIIFIKSSSERTSRCWRSDKKRNRGTAWKSCRVGFINIGRLERMFTRACLLFSLFFFQFFTALGCSIFICTKPHFIWLFFRQIDHYIYFEWKQL